MDECSSQGECALQIAPGSASAARASLRAWLAVASVAVGTFVMVTTEFLPVGLLTEIASSLGVSNGTAGLMVTTPGLVATVAAPLLLLGAGKLDRRIALWALTVTVIASNAIAAIAPSFPVLLIGRVLLGLCVGGFWTLAGALARRLVPDALGDRATAIVSAGVSVGTVCGVPAATLIGDLVGWRAAFGATSALGVLVLLAQIFFLPSLPTKEAVRARDLFALLRVPMARVGLGSVILLASGQFAAYTYLKPFLQQVPAMDSRAITGVLLAYGIAGFVGTFLAEAASARNLRASYIGMALILAAVMLLAPLVGANKGWATALVALWGLGFGAVPVCVQIWMYKASPEGLEGGSAFLVSTFQIAIAAGSSLGGVIVDRAGVSGAMILGGSLCLATGAVIAALSPRSGKSEFGAAQSQPNS